MNGRVANLTPLPHRLAGCRYFRTLVLACCCLMALALLGAVREKTAYRPEPLIPLNASAGVPAGALDQAPEEPMLASFSEPARPELLVTVPAEVRIPVKPSLASPAIVLPSRAPFRPQTRQVLMEVTAYCACKKCCGPRAQGITASGKRVTFNGGRFVAADPKVLKFNTKLLIPGYANTQPVQVIDKGGAIKGNKLDVFFASHQEARQWGRQKLMVTLVEE